MMHTDNHSHSLQFNRLPCNVFGLIRGANSRDEHVAGGVVEGHAVLPLRLAHGQEQLWRELATVAKGRVVPPRPAVLVNH